MVTEWQKLVCSTCGGTLEEKGGKLVCAHCKSTYQAKEKISEAEVIALNSATVDRNRYRFDDAQEKYDLILKDYPENAEANWGAFLCSYGIIYEEDYDGEFVPTCHRLSDCPVEKSPYYKKLTAEQKERAKEIEELRLKILEETKKIKPYDVFICYKQNEEKKGVTVPTRESKWARDIYEKLTNKYKLRVFFAEKSLEKSNADYEPHIYAALRSAKLMFVLTTSLEHLNAVWVANEWKRYVSYIRAGEDKRVRVVYDNVEPYNLPKGFQETQMINIDGDWMAAVEAAVADVNKVVGLDRIEIQGGQMGKKSSTIQTGTLVTHEIGVGIADTTVSEKQALEIAKEYLNDGQWSSALQMVDGVLYSNKNCAEALWYKFLAKKQIKDEKEFIKSIGAMVSFNKDALFTQKEIEENIGDILRKADKNFAAELLNTLYSAIEVCNIGGAAIILLDLVLPYNYADREKNIKECFAVAIKVGRFEVFKKLLTTLKGEEVDEYIQYNLAFADSKNAYSVDKEKVLKNVLSVDEGNVVALRKIFELSSPNLSFAENKKNFEEILKFSSKPDTEIENVLVGFSNEISNKNQSAFVKEILRYYSGDLKNLKVILQKLAFKMLEIKAFDDALELFSMLIILAPDDKEVYWGICLAKIKAKYEVDVIESDIPLTSIPEYLKYLTMVDATRRQACMALTKEQESKIKERAEKKKAEKEKRRQERNKKTRATISTILAILGGIAVPGGCIGCLSAWTYDGGEARQIIFTVVMVIGIIIAIVGRTMATNNDD